MEKVIQITAELIPEDTGGYTVYCPELNIYTQGDTEPECLENLKEAALLHIEEVGAEHVHLRSIQHHSLQLSLSE